MFALVSKMMVVLVCLSAALCAWQRACGRHFAFMHQVMDSASRLHFRGAAAFLVNLLHAGFALGRLLVSAPLGQPHGPTARRGLVSAGDDSQARLAVGLQAILLPTVSPKLRAGLASLASRAALGSYNGLSHGVNLLERFALCQAQTGLQLPLEPISL
jgi:hypothetical protein